MSKTLQGKYADKLNKQIEELYKVIDAKDKIINEQALEIARLERVEKEYIYEHRLYDKELKRLQQKIDKAIEYIKENTTKQVNHLSKNREIRYKLELFDEKYIKLLEILGDKE